MKKKSLISILLIMVLVASCFLTGCGSDEPAGDDQAAQGKVYHTYMSEDMPTLNPHNYTGTQLDTVFAYVHSTLWIRVPNEDGTGYNWVGDLAADLPEQIDELTWQVTLRDDACWQNGTPLTVDDLIYSWQMLIDPNLVNSMANFFWYSIDIANAEAYFNGECDWEDVGIKKIDDKTFQIITETPAVMDDVCQNFLDRSMFPVLKEAYEAGMNEDRTETSYGTELSDFVGAGPYILDTWTPDSVHVYKKNADHWNAGYYNYDTVEMYIVGENNARLQMFEQGTLDTYEPDSNSIDTYIDDPRMLVYGSTSVEHCDINCKNPENPISGSVNYRKALYHAFDRATIAEKCFGYYEPAGWYINASAGILSEDNVPYRETKYGKATNDLIESWGPNGYNPELAREYLAKAYEECGVAEDTVITLKLAFDGSDTNWKKTGEFIQQEWPEIFEGKIKVDILNYSGISTTEFKAGNDAGWDLSPNQWSRSLSRQYPYTAFYYYLSSYDGSPNNVFSDKFDAQYAACEAAATYEEQLAETQKLEEIYLEEVIHVPLVQYVNYSMYSDRVQLPMKQYVPGIGWGATFGDIVE